MNVDDLLADPLTSLVPDGVVPMHAIIIVDYVDPATGTRTLTALSDEGLPSWAMYGMLVDAYDLILAGVPYEVTTPDDDNAVDE